MKKHTKIYYEAFGYIMDKDQFVPSEIGGRKAVDIHHIIGRGKKGEDRIENLIALTRQEHIDYGDKKVLIPTLLLEHRTYLKINNVPFDNEWFEEKLLEYSGKS